MAGLSFVIEGPRAAWRACVRGEQASTATTSCWLFLRLLGVIYGIAFISLWTQVHGLIGSQGILPAQALLHAASRQLGPERYGLLPTLSWVVGAGDQALHALCGVGTLSAMLLALDVAPAFAALVAWAAYLSLTTIAREFLWFQWDSLLLEAGFLAIWLAPIRIAPRPSDDPPPAPILVWLLRWLLFRLMFSSGMVKLLSGDMTWRTLTALTYHYETQPLPTWIGWYAHQLPAWSHRASTFVMFVIELAVPALIFFPGKARRIACAALVGLQLLIMATGNYGFFNLLTIALCVLLLDDGRWPLRWRRPRLWRTGQTEAGRFTCRSRRWPVWIVGPLAGTLFLLSAIPLAGCFRFPADRLGPLGWLYARTEPCRLVNTYGLFAVMTTARMEIVVEGSDDGRAWLAYEFTDKPGALARPPRFVAPHQPRLDWQMWFAALGSLRQNPWFMVFCQRLLEGSPRVLALLAKNPFPDAPPRYVRALLYEYQFTTASERRETSTWWRRELKGTYCPPVSLAPR